MIRWLLWLMAGLLLGGIVHLVAVLVLPARATQGAYLRLSGMTAVNTVNPLPPITPKSEPLPFMDPAFATAVCRYDLDSNPIKLTVPVTSAYTSVTFHNREGVAYYAINDRSAGRRQIELLLMTAEQKNAMPDEEDVTSADRLIVESPSNTGLIVLRALIPEPGLATSAQNALAQASCKPEPIPDSQ